MATVPLIVRVSAVDQITAPLRAVTTQMQGFAARVANVLRPVQAVIGSITRTLFSLPGAIATLGATLVGGAIVRSFDQTAQAMDQVATVSRRLGLSAEIVSTLRWAAEESNASFEGLADAVRTAQVRVGQFVSTGSGRAAEVLGALNVELTDAGGRVKNINELIPTLARAINRLSDDAERAFVADRIFGANGLELLDVGADRLDEIAKSAKALGVLFTGDQLRAAAEYRDAIDRLAASWEGLKAQVVTALGPTVTGLLDTVAEYIRALPRLVENVGKVFSDAFTRVDADGENAMNKLVNVVRRAIALVGAAAASAVKVLIGVLIDGLRGAVPALTALGVVLAQEMVIVPAMRAFTWVKNKLPEWAAELVGEVSRLARTVIGAIQTSALGNSPATAWLANFAQGIAGGTEMMSGAISATIAKVGANAAAAQETAIDAMRAASTKSLDLWLDETTRSLSGFSYAAVATRDAMEDLTPYARSLGSALDDAFGITRALGEVAMPAVAARIPAIRDGALGIADAVSKIKDRIEAVRPTGFLNGLRDGFRQIAEQAADTYRQGVEFAVGLSQSISSNLGTAFVDAISGVKSLGDAIRDFASSALRQIAQVIAQMLIMRAIGGIASAFTAPTQAVTAGASAVGSSAINTMPTNLFAGMGFNSGGTVPGPMHINRDIVPALLTPGERVLSRREVAAVAAMDRGEAMGGPSVSIGDIVINVQGGGGEVSARQTAGAVRQAVLDAVIEGLQRSPRARGEMRRMVGGGGGMG
ncbi:MAG: hypothetical protein IOD15_15385 [Phycisphaerales bacterium]|nr:hypothetical protein [Phycisphaerales bacterium]